MRIGLIAPPWVAVPPPLYGGTEVIIDNLARGLDARGHDVSLFAVADSTCPVQRMHLYPHAVEPMGTSVAEAAHALAAYEALHDVDVIHDHTLLGPLLAGDSNVGGVPVVTTNHGTFTAQTRRIFAATARHASLIAISHDQRRSAGGVPIAAVIHHGIDLHQYREGPGDGDYLLFIGRMCADKGVDRAIRAAQSAGRRLVAVAKAREPAEQAYYEQAVRPLLTAGVELLGELPAAERIDLLRHASALVNPISWPEPFGLVMAEALACGTPVVTFPYGAAPEIVENGRTGFLCADEDEMVDALRQVETLDRHACRVAAEQRFSLDRMVNDHERLYRSVLAGDINLTDVGAAR